MHARVALVALVVAFVPARLHSQLTPLSRTAAIETALERGPRVTVARADTAVAGAALTAARALPNPSLSASYSRSVPRYHVSVDVPIDFPMLRQLRIRAAGLGVDAARVRYRLARATIALDADTTYTRAIAARERLAFSKRNALDADSVLHMVERRRDAGDASDMDVELARVNAGQQANIAIADSLTLVSTLLDLQAILGMATDRLEITVVDSLGAPPPAPAPGTTLAESAANVALQSAEAGVRLQHRSIWSLPTLSFGFETDDPDAPGILPTFGIGIALPIFDRNRGAIAQAEAERARAAAELALARVDARNQIAHAARARQIALDKATRDRGLIASAERVASMSLTAYREGAATLASILEARRAARDLLAQFVDDLATAWIATAELRPLSISAASAP
jgi:cobalt-zinc-cadmium efflux system outer membrane protein